MQPHGQVAGAEHCVLGWSPLGLATQALCAPLWDQNKSCTTHPLVTLTSPLSLCALSAWCLSFQAVLHQTCAQKEGSQQFFHVELGHPQGAAEARPPSGPACFALGGKASPRRSLLAACMFPSSFHRSPKRLTSSSVTSNPKARFCFGAVPYSLTATRPAQRGKRQPEAYKETSCWIGPQAQGLGLEEQHSQAKPRACP